MLKQLIPQGAKKILRHYFAKKFGLGYYQGPYPTWDNAIGYATGYDDATILAHVVKAHEQAKATGIGFERDGAWIQHQDYPLTSFAHLLALAQHYAAPLRVIDFGGGLGSTYFQLKQFCPALKLNWQVVEQPHFVKAAHQLDMPSEIQWFDNIAQCHSADVLILSAVLQYLPHPFEMLKELTKFRIPYWLIDRAPISNKNQHQIYVQHLPASLYAASYPAWIFSDFKKALKPYGTLMHEFDSLDGNYDLLKLKLCFKGFLIKT